MAGRLSKAIPPTDRTIITPFDTNYILRRSRYGPGFKHMINEGYKWTVAANVPQDGAVPQDGGEPNNLVEAQFMLEQYYIEISVPITSGLQDFLGPENWIQAERYANNPHGPVEMAFLENRVPSLRSSCRIFRVGSVIKPVPGGFFREPGGCDEPPLQDSSGCAC